jgi:hypothetical protein
LLRDLQEEYPEVDVSIDDLKLKIYKLKRVKKREEEVIYISSEDENYDKDDDFTDDDEERDVHELSVDLSVDDEDDKSFSKKVRFALVLYCKKPTQAKLLTYL